MQPHANTSTPSSGHPSGSVYRPATQAPKQEYTPEYREEFRRNPSALIAHAKAIEAEANGTWGIFLPGLPRTKGASGYFGKRMADMIKDEQAIQLANVSVHSTHVARCTEDGVVDGDGLERNVDTIVSATGFDNPYRLHFRVVGKGGVDLRVK
ncbi:hypothetical protein C8A03DRAFT_36972 [Achaetomium macrosporum]|uniref:Uncharacterized protein n=1 Tax=Achaetomium macrosporum TaxID=79813 RepID=A0AAN7H8I7_9PEZI|nr:hypothetical protein C8A03DRAFT_36972 [Achaetomium macrosporum]